jgi:CRISPR/Cas system CMR-associated protein Cmr1 (group 7 of RAMP superfamily)
MNWKKEIEFLTPLFCRGAYQDTPELRAPSIRGLLRWWFRTLDGAPDEEKSTFGGLNRFGQSTRGQPIASRLVVRVSSLQAKRAAPDPLTLPHKQGRQGSPQAAFAAGGRFVLEVSSRLDGLSPELARKVESALEVLLLLGGLGLRANRAGGSIWPADGAAPKSVGELRQRLDYCRCAWAVSLAGVNLGKTAEELRAAATNTVEGYPEVFGRARGGRLASAVKMKVIRFGSVYRLLLTARERRSLDQAKCILQQSRKPLGQSEWEIV